VEVEAVQAARVMDFVGRIGGDEFLLVCTGIETEADAQDLRARIAVAVPLDLAGRLITPSASIGVAWTDDGKADAEELIATADAAMYASKRLTAHQPDPNVGAGDRRDAWRSLDLSFARSSAGRRPSPGAAVDLLLGRRSA
jgi:GGDEF domain-containing protein